MADDDLELLGSRHESAGQEQPARVEPSADDQAILNEIQENFKLACSVEAEQRRQEDEDLEFEGLDMWATEAREARSEHVDEVTSQKVPARPTVEINLIDQRVQQVIAEARQARLAISVAPKAGLATTTQANYYKGLLKSIQADSGANEVRLWALDRTAKCGRGAYRISVDFNNDEDFDLDIQLNRILDQSTVYFDVFAQLADRADADWGLLTDWISEKERTRRYPKKPLLASADAFTRENDPWFAMDDNRQKSYRIVTYWKVVYEDQILVHHPQLGKVGPMPFAKLPAPLQEAIESKHPSVRSRPVPKRTVMQYIVDGSQVLEKDRWLGRYIPLIPVTGKEYNIKGKRSWKGLVTNAKDLNRGYIVTISSALEAAASMPRAPYVMYAGQDAGFEPMWDDSPIKAYTRLYINPVLVDGKPAPLPQRLNQEPAIQGALLLARALKDDIGSVLGSVDPATRAVRPYDRSGKAIEALQRQGAAGSSNFLDNLATISMVHEGRQLIDLIPKVYDTPGRVISITGEEHDDETAIMLKVPFVHDAEGRPVPVPCPLCAGTGTVTPPRTVLNFFPRPQTCPACKGTRYATRDTMPKTFDGKKVEYVDLTEGQFKVRVSIGRNFETTQDEAMAGMTELSKAAPALVPVYADLWVRSMPFSGATEIADRIKKMNPHAKDEQSGEPELPPEFAQKFQALQAEHQVAIATIQKLTEALKTEQVKAESQKELLAMKQEAAEGLENLRQQHKLMQQTASTAASKDLEQMKTQIETMRQESEQHHEVLLELLQARHAQARDAAANETKLAVAEEAAKTERMKLFVAERARLGVGETGEAPPTGETGV